MDHKKKIAPLIAGLITASLIGEPIIHVVKHSEEEHHMEALVSSIPITGPFGHSHQEYPTRHAGEVMILAGTSTSAITFSIPRTL